MGVNIIATLYPKAGKDSRLVELLTEVSKFVHEKEPDTLSYQFYTEKDKKSGSVKVIVVESYKDMQAVKVHGGSDKFKRFNKQVVDEGLTEKPMQLQFIQHEGGFIRSKM